MAFSGRRRSDFAGLVRGLGQKTTPVPEGLSGTPETPGRPFAIRLPVLPGRRSRGLAPAARPTSGVTVAMAVTGITAGRVDCRLSRRQGQVVPAADLGAARRPAGVAKVVTSSMCRDRRREKICIVPVLTAAAAVCKVALGLAFSLSCLAGEVGAGGSGYYKMVMGRSAGSPTGSLRRAGRTV